MHKGSLNIKRLGVREWEILSPLAGANIELPDALIRAMPAEDK